MARITEFKPGKWLLALSMAAGVGACTDTTGVYRYYYDPAITQAQLDEILYPVESSSDFLLGLDLAVATLEYYGSPALAGAVSLRSDQRLRTLRTIRPKKLRARPGQAHGTSQAAMRTVEAFTVPAPLLGRTLVWDPQEGYVPSARPGAPAHGIRLVLYSMDPETGYPYLPRAELGYLDITDEDDAQGEGVRVLAVHTTGPSRVVADYYVWLEGAGSYEEGEMLMEAAGTVGDAAVLDLAMVHQLSWSRSQDHDELVMDYEFRSGGRSVELEGLATSRYEAAEWADFGFVLTVRGGGEHVDIEAYVDAAGALDGMVIADGYEVVRLWGTESAPGFEGADGYPLSRRDEDAMFDLWTRVTDVIWYADWLFVPGDLLLAAG